jgi:hypothetical protein
MERLEVQRVGLASDSGLPRSANALSACLRTAPLATASARSCLQVGDRPRQTPVSPQPDGSLGSGYKPRQGEPLVCQRYRLLPRMPLYPRADQWALCYLAGDLTFQR